MLQKHRQTLVYGLGVARGTTLVAYASRFVGTLRSELPRVLETAAPEDGGLGEGEPVVYALQAEVYMHLLRCTDSSLVALLVAHPSLPRRLAAAALRRIAGRAADVLAAAGVAGGSLLPMELDAPLAKTMTEVTARLAALPMHVFRALPPSSATGEEPVYDLAPALLARSRSEPPFVLVIEPAMDNDESFLRLLWRTDAARKRFKPPSFARRHPYVIVGLFALVIVFGLLIYVFVLAPRYGFSLLGDKSKDHSV
ncbi:uncharacterized protein AMSG_07192 [Thecamonas trahens ATCC 50062]|uniref:Uncharacterized protein n=1 Tax=Thecamonas trahens ATCC 50062 TaxID=461836 RepID=A0A0L0DF24_THETB|nr:hypothetical protein AMSG_07192 [Thecamonas trahens ATCC 50062]KNC50942.1 hypothetical protein AMSG_07192 [Thecamonas trahens ATCC 50062]|eukprot:XP_013756639.1 hypothetical protein AMSG_07192 [Thecamonas trahens ATCC 50062]